MNYNYLENEIEDIKEYIRNNYEEEEIKELKEDEHLQEELRDTLWCEDSITGNASGSYTFSTYKAEEYLTHNMDLLEEALTEFGYEGIPFDKGAEWCDVSIRCYLLDQALSQALEEV